ncbi:MAG TPA: tRNA 2-thiocytidine(32) synthetase TtcA, partial [Planctomycetota bacterium]|nr:tRNA 2-thiocytidine(32) synthetase TtcA [Planctomycetota bacterium]
MIPIPTLAETTRHLTPQERSRLRDKLSRTMLRTVGDHGLISEGDRILVAVSGGKDSYTMLDLLWGSLRKSPVRFELIAVHLDQGQPGYDGRALEEWLKGFGAPHEIIREDTYSIVLEQAAEKSSYCAPCSRLRRGILYTTAARIGCNKIALGHHRDDALETLLMNLFHAGRLQAMPARYSTNDGRFEVIRPLIECAEDEIALHASGAGYPIIPCKLCGSQPGLQRDAAARLLASLEREIPGVRGIMLSALKNVRPSHLLDREVAEAWEAAASRY